MKLITLNLWGGQVHEPLLEFLKSRAQDTDIFCFQEVIFGEEPGFTAVHKARINLFSEIQECLAGFEAFAYPTPKEAMYFQSEPLPEGVQAGQAIFVKNTLSVADNGGFRTYQGAPAGMDYGGKITGSCQWVEIINNNSRITVMSIHGLWQRDSDKVDTPERFEQSRILNEFIDARKGKRILCGDFNLRPDGESMKMLEEDTRNLIKEFGVTSTRSELYTKPGKFADYMLVSPEVEVKDFKVLSDVVSDHLPLLLSFQ